MFMPLGKLGRHPIDPARSLETKMPPPIQSNYFDGGFAPGTGAAFRAWASSLGAMKSSNSFSIHLPRSAPHFCAKLAGGDRNPHHPVPGECCRQGTARSGRTRKLTKSSNVHPTVG